MATLDPKVIGPFPCEFCQKKLPTMPGRTQHQRVAHAEELGNLQTGQSMGKSLAEVLNTRAAPASDGSTELEEKVARLEKQLAKVGKATRRRKANKVSP